LLAITNGSHFGQGMRVAPQAAIDDGQAEVVAVTAMPRGLLLLRLVRIYLGNHLGAPYVRYRQASDIGIRQNRATSGLDIDGESAPGGDITIRVIPGALRFSC
jgi:diacylglycerol kinase (ATP)